MLPHNADVQFVMEGIPVEMEAAVAESLAVEVVTTRVKRRQELQEEIVRKEKEVRSGVEEVRSGVEEVRSGVEEVRSGVEEVRSGVEEVRSGVEEVRSGVEEVRSGVEEVRSGVEEVRSGVEEIRSGVEEDIKAEIEPGNDYYAEPFSHIAMDIVDPLPRSRAGNKYILVHCDYATRYPEAVPLKSIDAESVAEELNLYTSCILYAQARIIPRPMV
eukprot:Em0001g3700a